MTPPLFWEGTLRIPATRSNRDDLGIPATPNGRIDKELLIALITGQITDNRSKMFDDTNDAVLILYIVGDVFGLFEGLSRDNLSLQNALDKIQGDIELGVRRLGRIVPVGVERRDNFAQLVAGSAIIVRVQSLNKLAVESLLPSFVEE